MRAPYPGKFHRGEQSLAAEAVGRALCRAGRRFRRKKFGPGLGVFSLYPKRARRTWGTRKINWLKRFQRHKGLHDDGVYTKATHKALVPYMKARERKLLLKAEKRTAPPPDVQRFKKLMKAMRDVHRQTPGYNYGGEHDGTIKDDLPTSAFDCSSSTSYVLYRAGMFPHSHAITSGEFASSWGEHGKGKYFTVWAHGGHVWTQLTAPRKLRGPYWRFDTGGGYDPRSSRSGARLRFLPRSTWGFTPRHWPGM